MAKADEPRAATGQKDTVKHEEKIRSDKRKDMFLTVFAVLFIAGVVVLAVVLMPFISNEVEVDNDDPVATVTYPSDGYVGVPILFDASQSADPDGEITAYRWEFGDGGRSIGAKPQHTFSATGDYTVTLTVEDRRGAEGKTEFVITILPEPTEYTVVSMEALFANATALLDKPVRISWSTVTMRGSYSDESSKDPSRYVYFYVTDNTTTEELDIFCEGYATRPADLNARDIVDIRGKFTYYDRNKNGTKEPWESWEITVRDNNRDKVEKLSSFDVTYVNATIAEVLADPMDYLENNKFIRFPYATVEDLGNLPDNAGTPSSSYYIYVSDNSTPMQFEVFAEGNSDADRSIGWYDAIDVRGEISYYDANRNNQKDADERWELKVVAYTEDKLEVVHDFIEPPYAKTTVKALIDGMPGTLGSYVELPWTMVSDPGRFGYGYGNELSDYTYFYVMDNSTMDDVEVFVGSNAQRAQNISWDDNLLVRGVFTWYDSYENGQYDAWESLEISVRPSSGDTVVMLREGEGEHPDYAEMTLAELFADPEPWVGEYVRIVDLKVTAVGGYGYPDAADPTNTVYFYATDGTTDEELDIYAEGTAERPAMLTYDDEVMAQGQFAWYDTYENNVKDPWETWELKVRKSSDDAIIVTQYATPTTYTTWKIPNLLQNLTSDPQEFDGAGVFIDNAVVSYTGRYGYSDFDFDPTDYVFFAVSDPVQQDKEMDIFVGSGSERPVYLWLGDTADVWGVLENDPDYGWEIIVRGYSTDRVVKVADAYYEDVTVEQLLASPASYIDKPVHVEKAVVTDVGTYTSDHFEGDYEFYLVNGTGIGSGLKVYLSGYLSDDKFPQHVVRGEVQRITGFFTQYAGTYELEINNDGNQGVEVLVPAQATRYTVNDLLSASASHVGELVTVTNAYVSDNGTYPADPAAYANLKIADVTSSSSLTVFVETDGTRPATLSEGASEKVQVTGFFTSYYSSYEVKVRSGTGDSVAKITSAMDTPPVVWNVTQSATTLTPVKALHVYAKVTDDKGLADVILHYSVDGGVLYAVKDMTLVGTDVYHAEIAAQSGGTTVKFFVEGVDTGSQHTSFPSTPKSATYVDNAPTLTGFTSNTAGINPYTAAWFRVTASDDVSVSSVTLHWRVGGGAWTDAMMNDNGVWPDMTTGDGSYAATVTAKADGTTVEYYISAEDSEGQIGTYPSAGTLLYTHIDNSPVISSVTRSPLTPNPWNATNVTALVTDDINLVSVTLVFDNGTGPQNLTMVDNGTYPDATAGDGVFSAQIPAQAEAVSVSYHIVAEDHAGQVTVGTDYSYLSTFNMAPTFEWVTRTPTSPHPYEVVTVKAKVIDDGGVAGVWLNYTVAGVNYSRPMFDDGTSGDDIKNDGVYAAQIPYEMNGTVIDYSVWAEDITGKTSNQSYTVQVVGYAPMVSDVFVPNRAAVGRQMRMTAVVEDDVPELFFQKTATLHYSYDGVAYANASMTDDGLGADLTAGDGVYTGFLPTGATPGTVQYFVTVDGDSAQSARSPALGQPDYYFYTPSYSILFDTGHGEWYSDFDQYFGDAVSEIGFYFDYTDMSGVDLGQYDVVMISDPSEAFDADETARLVEFVNDGGGLFLLTESDYLDYGRPENVNPILRSLGINAVINDDQATDPTDHYSTSQYIIYLNGTNGVFDLDTTGITAGLSFIETRSLSTVYNLSAGDIVIIRGDDDAVNSDLDAANPSGFHQYSTGDYPPLLVARDGVGSGRVVFGGLTSTFGDLNGGNFRYEYALEGSQLKNLTQRLIPWLANIPTNPISIGYIYNATPGATSVVLNTTIDFANTAGPVTLYYAVVNSEAEDNADSWTFSSVAMTDSGSGNYTATATYPAGSKLLRFYVEARDTARNGLVKPGNAPEYAYYAILASGQGSDLKINEFMCQPLKDWNNDGTLSDDTDEWVEIINNGDGLFVDICIDDADGSYAVKHIYGVIIWPHSVYSFSAGDYNGFGLADAGDTVRLLAPDGVTVLDSFTWAVSTTNDKSYGRVSDGVDTDNAADWKIYNNPTPGELNAGSTSLPIDIQSVSPPTDPSLQLPTHDPFLEGMPVVSPRSDINGRDPNDE